MYDPSAVEHLVTVARALAKDLPAAAQAPLQEALAALRPYTLNAIVHEHRHGISTWVVLAPGANAPLSEEEAKNIVEDFERGESLDLVSFRDDEVPLLVGEPLREGV